MSHLWKADLRAGPYYPDLASSFIGADISLTYENEDETGMYFYAYSDHLDNLSDPDAVSDRLLAFELLLNGALRLAYQQDIFFSGPVRFIEMWNVNTKQRHRLTSTMPEDDPFDPAVGLLVGGVSPVNPAEKLLAASRGDTDLRTLLFQVGMLSWPGHAGDLYAWGSLYKVYETAKTMASKKGINPYVNVTEAKIDAFTAACNNMSVLGLSARHGLTKKAGIPKNATTQLEEATRDVVAMATSVIP